MIKSAASATSRKTKSRGPRSREAPRPAAVCLPSRPSSGRFPGSWSPGFGLPGGYASSRLSHGFHIQNKEHFPIQTKNPFQVSKSKERVPKSSKRGSQPSKPFKNDEKLNNSANPHPQKSFGTGNSISRPGEGLGHGPGAPKRRKKFLK